MAETISAILEYLVPFLFVLGVLVFVHELGHFLVAKRAGIRVEVFSLGYAPKLLGKKIGETEYRISWIPFGGYVKMAGEADVGKPEIKGQPWEFPSKSVPVRMAVIAAGPVMNLLLAFLVFSVLFFVEGVEEFPPVVGLVEEGSLADQAGFRQGDRIVSVGGAPVDGWDAIAERFFFQEGASLDFEVERDGARLHLQAQAESEGLDFGLYPYLPAVVASVVQGSPAQDAGLLPGDEVVSIDDEPVHGWEDMRRRVSAHPGDTLLVAWVRGQTRYQAPLVPSAKRTYSEENETIEYGVIGITRMAQYERLGPFASLKYGALQTYAVSGEIVGFLRKLLVGRASPKLLGGPLMIAELAGESARVGLKSLFFFIAFLSINLALVNILPIPALDGGHLVFLTVEGIVRRPLSPKQRAIVQQIGLAFLLFIMVFVVINDLARYFAR